MATLVFKLKYAPEEEANEIRQLLEDNQIDFYETNAGRWQISLAGLWVRDKEQAKKALLLIKEEQVFRSRNMVLPSFKDYLLGYLQHAVQNPIESIFTLLAITLIIGLSTFPFFL